MSFLDYLAIVSVLGICAGTVESVLKHRQKMAGVDKRNSAARIEALERRVEALTELVHAQTIALDGLGVSPTEQLRERVGAR